MIQPARRPIVPAVLAPALPLLAGLLAPTLPLVAGLLAPAAASAAPVAAEYTVHAAGLTLMRARVVYDLDGPGGRYHVTTQVRLTGLASTFGGGEQQTGVEGRWQGAEPRPDRYRAAGTWRGTPRRVAMDWQNGSPVILALEPANTDREPVPEALQRGTIDGLSALAKLARTVAATGRCDAQAALYDGRRRTDQAVRTVGTEALALTGGASTTQLRCRVETRVLAGRHLDQDPAEAAKPQQAEAWFAPIGPGGDWVATRVDLPTRWFGTVRIQLAQVGPAAAPPRLTDAPRSAPQQAWDSLGSAPEQAGNSRGSTPQQVAEQRR